MRIRGEPNPTRRLEVHGKDETPRARGGGSAAARLPAGAAAAARGASALAPLPLPADHVSVRPRVSLPLQWGRQQLEAFLQVAVEAGPGLSSPGTIAEGPVAFQDEGGTFPPPGGNSANDRGKLFRLVLNLCPPHLGPVQVVLRVREGAVSGELWVADAAALRAAEQALPRLKASLGRWLAVAGLKVRLLTEMGDHPVPPGPSPGAGARLSRDAWEPVRGGAGSGTGGEGHGRLDLHV